MFSLERERERERERDLKKYRVNKIKILISWLLCKTEET